MNSEFNVAISMHPTMGVLLYAMAIVSIMHTHYLSATQCATHLFFGWKIQVEGSGALVSAPLFAFLTVAAILVAFINL